MSRPVPKFDIEPVLRHYGADIPYRTGSKVRMCCPFHDDRNPSATLLRDGQRFVCFACDLNEDALGLLMREEGIDFASAIERAKTITGTGSGTAPSEPEPVSWLFA